MSHSPSAPGRWGPRWSRWVGRFLARVYWNTEVRGVKNVPARGPVVVVGNHLGLLDGPLVHGVLRRGSHFLITQGMFWGPLKVILMGAGQIPVHDSGRAALAKAKAILGRGDIIGIFPEGARGRGSAETLHGGSAWLALHTKARVVPVAIFGTRHTGEDVNVWPRPRRRILVEFGAPLELDPPIELRGSARQRWAERELSRALRNHVVAVSATTPIKLPADEPTRHEEN